MLHPPVLSQGASRLGLEAQFPLSVPGVSGGSLHVLRKSVQHLPLQTEPGSPFSSQLPKAPTWKDHLSIRVKFWAKSVD